MIKYFIMTIIISIFVPIMLRSPSSTDNEVADKNCIYVTRFYYILGIIGVTLFASFGIAMCFAHENDNILSLIFSEIFVFFLCSTGMYLILHSKNFKIYLGEVEFEYINFLGVKRVYKYSEILRITIHYNACGIDSYKIHLKHKKITISYDLINFNKFEKIMIKRLKSVNNIEAIPQAVSKSKAKTNGQARR